MKRSLPFLLAAMLLLSGCSGNTESISQTAEATEESSDILVTEEAVTTPVVTTTAHPVSEETTSTVPETAETDETIETAETIEPVTEIQLPSMDGSTSAIPLEAGLRAELLDITYTEALSQVEHTKTHTSFQRLLDGEVDLIFTVPISAEQQGMADAAGVELISVPVAKEGFVFVVNKDNPVESLTQQQIRDIYSGRITNWKEVGGNDAEIIAYQRNADSGSQNYMVEFMGDVPLTQAETELYATGMGGLMDRIALYDNSVDAIGYSVYSYAAQMYANENAVKFIEVDGIAPAKETMADNSYPLCSETYIMFTDKADDITRNFTDWVTSDEGQLCVLRSGYLPVNGMEIPAEYMPYSAVGTGKPKPADYKPSEKYQYAGTYQDDFFGTRGGGYYYIKGLTDDAFEEQINADIKEAQDHIIQFAPDMTGCTDSYMIDMCKLAFNADSINGYLSIKLSYWTPDVNMDHMSAYPYGCYEHAVSLVYDLVEQKRITEFSDLFYEGEDFVPMLNNAFAEHADMYAIDTDIEKKSDFSGLLGDVEVFTLDGVCLNENNSYFNGMPLLSFDHCDPIKDSMVIWEYRDCTGIFDSTIYLNDWPAQEFVYGYYDVEGVKFEKYESSRFHTQEELDKLNEDYHTLQMKLLEYYKSIGSIPFRFNISYGQNLYMNSWDRYDAYSLVYFDADTLEPLDPEELLCENWRDYFDEELRDEISFVHFMDPDDIDEITIFAEYPVRDEYGEPTGGFRGASAIIPRSALNPRYFGKTAE